MKCRLAGFGMAALLATGSLAAEPLPKWELGLGAAGVTLPEYRGSDERSTYLLPFPWIVYRLEWLKADRSGVKTRVFDSEHAEVNLSMSATPPVRSKRNAAREGMPDLKPTLEFGPSLDLHLWESRSERTRLDLRLPLRASWTVESQPRYAGLDFSPRLNLDVRGLFGNNWRLGVLTGPVFGTARHHEYIYSVQDQFARPDRPAYRAPGGYAGWQNLVAVSRQYDTVWVGAFLRYDSLHGAAFEDSPLVRRKHYASAGFAVSWILSKSSTMVNVED